MARAIAVVGAPSSIGIRPYDDGAERHLNRTPSVLRERGLIARLRATDLGDVPPPAYKDFTRTPNRVRNEEQVLSYTRSLAERVTAGIANGYFGLVVGGDCSIVLACLMAARQKVGGPVGLAYIDAHADFATPEESRTGSAASMALGLATGRGDTPLARLAGPAPLASGNHVAIVGRRDGGEPWYGHAALAESPILDIPSAELTSAKNVADLSAATLAQVSGSGARGFWIQVDADVLDPVAMPAVDSPEPGGPTPDELVTFLTPLVQHPRAIGLSLTIYDPALDPDRSGARQLIGLLERLLAGRIGH